MTTPPRVCRTSDEAFRAGWDDAAADPPLTAAEVDRLVTLHARYLLRPRAA